MKVWHEVRVMESACALEFMRHEWNGLAEAAEECPTCMTYEYCALAAKRVYAQGGFVAIIIVRRCGDLVALWPLAIHRKGPLRVARVLTCGTGDEYGDPLVKNKEDYFVVEEFQKALRKFPADFIELMIKQSGILQKYLRAYQSVFARIISQKSESVEGFSIKLGGFARWDDFWASLPQPFRANLRRRRKLLNATGRVEVGWCKTVEDADAVLKWLFATKRDWAESRSVHTKYPINDQIRDFFRALAQHTDLSTTPLVAFVKVDGVPVAASLNMVGRHSVEYHIATYDEAFCKYSVGTLLVEFLAKWSYENGRDFDLRTSFGHYKARWANCREQYINIVLFSSIQGRFMEIPYILYRELKNLRDRLSSAQDDLQQAIVQYREKVAGLPFWPSKVRL